MKRIALLLTAIALTCASANAQSFPEKLGNRAKNAVERNLGNKVEEPVDPYTVTGRPLHSIPIGLPQNDDAPAPTSLPADCVSYCAYEFDPV
ncbi:MAG: hypothetical protein IJP93_08605, partial [Bacteroidales bacterium]|nr:hypothetical protein [Bacteroidales bacterium]